MPPTEVPGTKEESQFLYDGDELVAEYQGATMQRRYVHGAGIDDPVTWYEGAALGQRHSLLSNHQGSIVAVADSAGNALAVNSYDPWGIPGAANLGRFASTGQIDIPELGMYHYKARIYSPTLGRFLQTDPVGYKDQVNLYAYVANDPVGNLDPSGEEIVLAAHNLAFGVSHTKIIIVPENQARYRDLPAYRNNRLPDGRHFATLGAGPEHGRLVSRVNRPTDVDDSKNNYRHVLALPRGMTEDQAIANLDAAERRFNDRLDYDLLPGSQDGHNSNSFTAGVLREAGFRNVPQVGYSPGFLKPVPPNRFSNRLPESVCARELTTANRSGCQR